MRVFIGIQLPTEVKEYLDHVSRLIQQSTYKGQFTLFDNYHITIKYIGEATPDDLDTLEELLDYVAKNVQPFALSIEDLGSFYKKGKYIVWMGINQGKQALKGVYNRFESLMEENGFQKEHRKFQPHITLGNKIVFSHDTNNVEIPTYHDLVRVDEITLFWSHREDGDLVYTPIYTQSLTKG